MKKRGGGDGSNVERHNASFQRRDYAMLGAAATIVATKVGVRCIIAATSRIWS